MRNQTLPATAVLFQTHYLDAALARQLRRLRAACPAHYRVFVLMHVAPGTPKPPLLETMPHHFVTTPEIRDPGYLRKSAGGPEWRIRDGGHTDLPMLHFARAHPEFDRYWTIEYDVRFSGSWSTLFAAFEGNPADLLTTNLRSAESHPGWIYWYTLQAPEAEAGVETLAAADRITSFMPIYRVSRQGVEAVDRAYHAGWGGHSEATWPTLIRRAGLSIEDLGGNGAFVAPANRGRFYTSTPTAWDLAAGSFIYKPAKHGIRALFRRNMLWHPVKPLPVTLREDRQRVRAKLALWRGRLLEALGRTPAKGTGPVGA